MPIINDTLTSVGASVPETLLPSQDVDLHRFAVVACDQFSSQPEYWHMVQDVVDGAPSSLHMILPEAFLKDGEEPPSEEIAKIMQRYIDARVLVNYGQTLVFTRRRTSSGFRHGLIIALDLEQYDYRNGWSGLIRATEGTVEERLPARVKIRQKAPLEMPHIMVFIDDKNNLLMNSLNSKINDFEQLYSFTLMQGGGNIEGYRVDSHSDINEVAEILSTLKKQSPDGMLYAMGDGNHSVAAAKNYWNELKQSLSEEEQQSHPARWILVELVNIYDPALAIEPIHRVLFNVDPEAVQREVGFDAKNPPSLQILQPKLDEWLANHPEAVIDYIHGEDECISLGSASDRLSIVFPAFDKQSLFEVVRRDGCFVRKSFSIGHASDKRYYLECRKINR